MKYEEFVNLNETTNSNLTHIEVVYSSRIEHSEDPHYTNYTNEIYGIKIVKNERDADFSVPFEVVKGKDYYLLYIVYSSGSSMDETSGLMDFINLYDDIKIAKENLHRMNTVKNGDNTVKLLSSQGKEYKLGVSKYTGWFDNIIDVDLKIVNI